MTATAGPESLRTPRTTLKRRPQRGAYDFATIASILDEAIYCHVGFADEEGQPFVIPTNLGRDGRTLYVHGSAASRTIRRLAEGVPICLTATLLDGLVLARAAHAHSINYRSVVILGTAKTVEGPEKLRAMEIISEHVIPGRWAQVRAPTELELKAITVLKIEVTEGSAKVRSGPPLDDEEDLAYPVWAGVLPLSLAVGAPVPSPGLLPDISTPDYVEGYGRSTNPLEGGSA
jgi:nitroimidazol reductase NimA-like FMN-containing flavoprotein (pyridoxamine 5'-phosphate oxidase superfamily)